MKLKTNYSKNRIPPVVPVAALLVLAALLFLIIKGNWLGARPEVTLVRQGHSETLPTSGFAVGLKLDLEARLLGRRGGLCGFKAEITQGSTNFSFAEVNFKSPGFFSSTGSAARQVPLTADFAGRGFTEGPASLTIEAKNCALFKRKFHAVFPLTIDLSPPQVSITSSQHYVNQGGADVVTYQVSSDAIWSGVKVGPYEFVGHATPESQPQDGKRFAFFVFSYELLPETRIEVVARDAAGNQTTATLTPARFFPKEFRHRDLPVDDNFIQTKVSDILSRTPEIKRAGDNLADFLQVNRDLRKKNAAFLKEIAAKSDEKFYWKDAFKPLGNAAVEAGFADYRSYIYNGQKVDEQVHLGFDLAVTEKYPVTAANSGRVAFAGYLGIYGNTVLLDHGYGLTTLYGHLSGIDVKEGDLVARDQKLGNSGATGLAGGDHLHFSLLIDGVQTNPVEFWDQHWIDDHVYLRLNGALFGKQ